MTSCEAGWPEQSCQGCDAGECTMGGSPIASLAQAIYDTGEVNLPLSDALDVDCFDVARAMIKAGLA